MYGLLRPDKLVLYAADKQPIDNVAAELIRDLASTPSHGVPFTAQLDDKGILSWGCDPPRLSASTNISTSWRLWVTNRIARALLDARVRGVGGQEAVDAALRELETHGVDIQSWAPPTWSSLAPDCYGADSP